MPFLRASSSPASIAHRERLLLFHREQRNAADLLEIHPNRIVEREPVGDRLLGSSSASRFGLLFLLLVDDLDAERRDLFEELVDLLGRDVFERVERGVDFFIGQRAALLAARDQLLLEFVQRRRRRFGHRGAAFLRAMLFFTPFLYSLDSLHFSPNSRLSLHPLVSLPSASNSSRSSSEEPAARR